MPTNPPGYQHWWRHVSARNWETTYQAKLRNYRQTQDAPNSYTEWTAAEDAAITTQGRPCDRELSTSLGRSMKAIQNRRSELKKRTTAEPTNPDPQPTTEDA